MYKHLYTFLLVRVLAFILIPTFAIGADALDDIIPPSEKSVSHFLKVTDPPGFTIYDVRQTYAEFYINHTEGSVTEIYKLAEGEANYVLAGTYSGPSDGIWRHDDLRPRTRYYFKARSLKDGTYSAFSNINEFFSGSDWFNPDFSGTAIGPDVIELRLTDRSYQEGHYEIISQHPNGYFFYEVVEMPDSGRTVTFRETGLQPGTTYSFRVMTSLNEEGNPFLENVASDTVTSTFHIPEILSTGIGATKVKLEIKNLNPGSTTNLYRSLSRDSGYQLVETKPNNEQNFEDDGLTPGVTYHYKAQATGSNGVSEFSRIYTFTTINEPGWHAPEFTAVATGPRTIELHLTDKSYQDYSYEIGTDHYDYTFLEEVTMSDSGRTLVLTAANVEPGITYSFHVNVFFDGSGGTSPQRVASAIVTTPFEKPVLSANSVRATFLTLNVTNLNTGTHTKVYRSEFPDDYYELIGTIPFYFESFEDRDLIPGKTYFYKARVEDSDVYSDVLPVTTLAVHHPTLTARALNNTTIELSLTDNSSIENEYEIFGTSPSGNNFYQIVNMADSGRTEILIHNPVSQGTTYTYSVDMHVDRYGPNEEGFYNVATASVTTSGTHPCANTGFIDHEVWNNIPGTDVSAIPVNTAPSSITSLSIFETRANLGSNYGARVRGYVCPPLTGYYTFWIASDDKSELWISTSDDPAGKFKIASVSGHTKVRQWDRYPSQKSVLIHLEHGRRYYIEALHKEASGGDHLAVGWQLPDGTLETPISGMRLVKFEEPVVACEASGSIKWDVWTNQTGTSINYAALSTSPNATMSLDKFESPQYYGNNYLSRASGYVCVPQSGEYTFWIASDDKSDLWLSTDESPDNKVKIASVANYTRFGDWEKYATQKSAPVYLLAGNKYYIEAVHKEGPGADYVAVGWQMPDGTMERPIPGNRLIPFQNGPDFNTTPRIAPADGSELSTDDSTNPISLSPNPVENRKVVLGITMDDRSGIHEAKIKVISLTGDVVHTGSITCTAQDCSNNLLVFPDDIRPGIYVVNVFTNGKLWRKKLIVK